MSTACSGIRHGLSLCIPVLDEQFAIGDVLRRSLALADRLAESGISPLEIIVVDDGSQDRSAAIVRTFPQVRLVSHASTRGYGAALKTAFAEASHELIAFIDGDGTYPPEVLPVLCAPIATGTADLVIGSRRGGAPSHMPLVRRAGNALFAALLSRLTRTPVADSTSGLRVFRRTLLERLGPLPDGLHLTPTMSRGAIRAGLRIVEIPVPYDARIGRSKLNVMRDGVLFLGSILGLSSSATASERQP